MDLRRCPACQLTVTLEPGRLKEAVPCRCGTLIPPASTAAGMMQCPFCGAPADRRATRCGHCAIALKTLRCPACFALGFVGTRHCVACGGGLAGLAEAQALGLECPRCHKGLVGDPSGASPGAASCLECAGLWLDHSTFGRIQEQRRRRSEGLPPRVMRRSPTQTTPDPYLRCPACNAFMNRTNFARLSGVLIDVCRLHGLWFDADELQAVLEFVEEGGLQLATRREAEAQAERLRRLRADKNYEAINPSYASSRMDLAESKRQSLLLALLDVFFD